MCLLRSAPPASSLRRNLAGETSETPPGGRTPFPMDLMLLRIDGCTRLLAQNGPGDAPTTIDDAIAQILLADIGLVTGYLRCQADDLSGRLTQALSEISPAQE